MVTLNLIQNLALLIALSIVHSFIFRRIGQRSMQYKILSGLLFGGITVVGMMTPVKLMTGIIFDGRSIILSTAGVVAGPVVAATAAVISGAFRLWIGGDGVWMGLAVIFEASFLGTILYYLRQKHPGVVRVSVLWGFGMLVHMIMVMLTFMLPGGVGPAVASQIALPVLLVYPVVTMVGCFIFLDQEEHIRTDRALRESEERYRRLFHNNHTPMLVIVPDAGEIVDANPAACRYYGWSYDQLTNMKISDINILNADRVQTDMASAKAEAHKSFLFQHRRADGTIRDVEVYSGPITVHGRDLVYSIIHDVTDRKLTETALEERTEDLNRAQAVANIGSWRQNFKSGTIRLSEESCCILGIPDGTTVTRDSLMGCVHPGDRRVVGNHWNAALEGDPYDIEYRLLPETGQTRWVREICRIDPGPEGRPAEAVGIIQDITGRKRSEEIAGELGKVRETLWTMKSSNDFRALTVAVYQSLKRLRVEFHALGINYLQETEADRDDVRVFQIQEDGSFEDITGVAGRKNIYEIWKSGSVSYRKNLDVADDLNEKQILAASFGAAVLSVIDIPFSYGTLAVNSTRAEAFSESDISLLQKMADILSEGFTRLEDLKKLENYTQELEREIQIRKKSEEILKESEATHKAMIANISDVIAIIDRKGTITYKSPNIEKLFGWRPEELIGLNGCDTAHPDDMKRIWNEFRSLVAGERSVTTVEYRYRCRDGSYRLIELTAANLLHDPIINGVLVNYHDITERWRAEEALRESEERYREVFANTHDGIFIIGVEPGPRFCYLGFNPAEERFIGLESKDLLGKYVEEVVGHDLAELVTVRYRECVEKGDAISYDEELELRSGKMSFFTTLIPMKDAGGNVHRIVGVSHDVTQHKSAVTALRDSEANLRRAQKIAHVGSWRFDMASRKVYVSAESRRIYGVDDRDLLIEDVQPIPLPEYRDALDTALRDLVRSGTPYDLEFRIRRQNDGALRHIHSMAEYDRELNIVIGTIQDITDRKNAEEALRQSEEKFRSIAEQMTDMIFLTDAKGVITYVSPSSEKMFGYPPEEMQGRHFTEYLDQMEEGKAVSAFLATVNDGSSANVQLRMKRKDGTIFYGELNGTRSRFGPESGTVGLIRDVTERRVLEQQLLQAQKMETVGRLAGGVAHDFNNILTVINANAEIPLLSMPETDPFHEAFTEIKKAGDRAAALTRQLLAFSRKQIIEPRAVNLNTTLLEMDKMLRRLIGEDVKLVTVPDETLKPVFIDPGQVEQVLTNLVVNARDAMPNGGRLTVETRNVTLDEEYCRVHRYINPGDYVMFSVSDTGIGMDGDTLSHVFEPFFTTKPQESGTGLGLSTCYGIVKQNNGGISIYSEPGRGTSVKVYLPVYTGDFGKHTGHEKGPVIDRGSERVLLVEDEATIRKIAAKFLLQAGYSVIEAVNGEEGLSMAQSSGERIELLITDVVMPLMGGRELADRLKSLYPDIKVLYMSGYTDNSIVHHGVLDPGIHFIQKPFSMQAFSKKVREVLDN